MHSAPKDPQRTLFKEKKSGVIAIPNGRWHYKKVKNLFLVAI